MDFGRNGGVDMKKNEMMKRISAVLLAVALAVGQCVIAYGEETAAPEDSVSQEAVTEKIVTEEATVEEPEANEPVVNEPEAGEPEVSEPVQEEPGAGGAEADEPSTGLPTGEVSEPEIMQENEPAGEDVPAQISFARINEGGSPIPVGAKVNLKEEFGLDSDCKGVKYTITSGKSLAEISGSTLIAKKAGDVDVKVTYKYDGEKSENETSFTIYTVGFRKKTVTLNEKGEYDATQNLKGDTVEGSPTWSSSAQTVATVDPSTGKVNVLAGGTTMISAEYSYGEKTKICKFKLYVKLPGLKVSEKKIKFGGTFSTKIINLEKGTQVSWYLENGETRAAFIDQEKGKIKITGLATDDSPVLLHAKAGSEELTCRVTTTEPYLGGLPKNYDEEGMVVVKRKNTKQFSVKGIAKGTPVTWSSSDEETVSVTSKGLVKAKQYGGATVTANVEGYGELSVYIEVPDPADRE